MGLITLFKQLKEVLKERRIERLTAKAADLSEDKQYDLLFLHKKGFVRAMGTGQSITKIYADVENLTRRKLCVAIKPGTYFVSSGNHQNMASTTEYTFTLYECSTQQLGINAVCINANRPIPGQNDCFRGVKRVPDNVASFLEASENADPMVIQAGIWTLTDNYSRSDVKTRLISKDNEGNTWHPITDDHVDQAKAILDELGITHHLHRSSVKYENKTEKYDNGQYSGEFRYGERHGNGIYTWNNGDVYDGKWHSNKRTGQGIYTSKDGYKYVGSFVDGKKHGRGKATWANLTSYDGEWHNDKYHGEGIYTCANAKYVGKFDEGIETGGWYYYGRDRKRWCYRNSDGELVESRKNDKSSSKQNYSTHTSRAPEQESSSTWASQHNDHIREKHYEADRYFELAIQYSKDLNYSHAFEALKQCIKYRWDHPSAIALLKCTYCPVCKVVVSQPSPANSVVDYARFWRGACPKCEAPLVFLKQRE